MTTETLRGRIRPPVDDGWVVQTVTRCDRWSAGCATCPACGEAVPLDNPHVGVQLVRIDGPGTRKAGLESVRRAFCSDDCVDRWLVRREE